MSLTLTADQERAVHSFTGFLADESETAFVLEGYAGTGKSTMMRHIMDTISKTLRALKLVNPKLPDYEIQLTATTNKAADNLAEITGASVPTIHSFLGLRVETDYKTRKTTLVSSRNTQVIEQHLLFIDEASYIDSELLGWIFKKTKNTKVVFIGDPAQLIPVKAANAPVFKSPFPKAQLTQVVRQAEGNPVLDLATKFRHTVNTGEFFSFTPDGHHVQHLSRQDFESAVKAEFLRPDWSSKQSKILGWTNKTVDAYNKVISELANGRSTFQVDDWVQCNKYYSGGKSGSIKTDELVRISAVSEPEIKHGVPGHYYTVNGHIRAFCADNLVEKKKLLAKAKAAENYSLVQEIEEAWIDLREVYACTINKSQGSTYDRVFIDLDDLKKCNSGETIARLLYVGVSRARHQVIFTGDLV